LWPMPCCCQIRKQSVYFPVESTSFDVVLVLSKVSLIIWVQSKRVLSSDNPLIKKEMEIRDRIFGCRRSDILPH
jgi:hypothetical protein